MIEEQIFHLPRTPPPRTASSRAPVTPGVGLAQPSLLGLLPCVSTPPGTPPWRPLLAPPPGPGPADDDEDDEDDEEEGAEGAKDGEKPAECKQQ